MKKRSVIACLLGGMVALTPICGRDVNAAETVLEKTKIVSGSIYEYLDNYEARLRNTYIRSASASLSISGSTATGTGSCSKYATASGDITIYVYLQKQSGNSWSTVSSASGTFSAASGAKALTAAISKGTYRTKTSCWVNGENIVVLSSSKTY